MSCFYHVRLPLKLEFFCFATLFLIAFFAFPQQKVTISGTIKDAKNGELLAGVVIYDPFTRVGTSSNNFGFYSITLPSRDTIKLDYRYLGYFTLTKRVLFGMSQTMDILLEPEIHKLEEVVVQNENLPISEQVQASAISLPVQQIMNVPALMGERDLIKVIQLLPGVQKGTEGSSGFYVRGGGPDQNLILLDDAIVYNATHLFGFFSIFNGQALKSVELIKGGFPARYGGRLSSVLDIRMKDGNQQKWEGEAGVGFIASRFTLEGPLIKDKSSIIISARRTYIDILTRPFMTRSNKAGYYFYDFNTKINYTLNSKNRLYLSGYLGRDEFYFRDGNYAKGGLNWGNTMGAARWNHIYNSRLFSNTSLIYSQYRFLVQASSRFDDKETMLRYATGIDDLHLKHDVDYYVSASHQFKFGVSCIAHRFLTDAITIKNDFTDLNIRKSTITPAFEFGLYAEDFWKIRNRIILNPGFRLSHFFVNGKNYVNPEPRISAMYRLKSNLSAKASFSMMNQYVHLLSNTGQGLPTDLWVPATNTIGPQASWQLANGLSYYIEAAGLQLGLEGYYKQMNNAIAYKEGVTFLSLQEIESNRPVDWQLKVTTGRAWSYGTELFVQKKYGKINGWIGYTLSWTKMQFDALNFGNPFFARYDRRHDFSAVCIYEPSNKFTISTTWVYSSGNALSIPVSSYNARGHNLIEEQVRMQNSPTLYGGIIDQNQFIDDHGERNNFRAAPFHRLDISLQYHKKLRWAFRTWDLSFYNAYNRANPFFYYIVESEKNGKIQRSLSYVSLFPILPSLTYALKW